MITQRNYKIRRSEQVGFTLVETLVSLVILILLLVILASITSQTSRTVGQTLGKMDQFRAARTAFESMNRLLSQATLNTYWDYDNPANPTKYQRRSELRFVSGNMVKLAGNPPVSSRQWPTHGIFFQAPLGFADGSSGVNTNGLVSLLNTCGFFVEFGSDSPGQPSILAGTTARYRYRLCQFIQPTDTFSLYKYTSGVDPATGNPLCSIYNGRDWFVNAVNLSDNQRPVRFLADNVIALIILPRLSQSVDSTGTLLAPAYSYDSTQSNANALINSNSQLPPEVQITMVAIDEASAARLVSGTTMPDFGLSSLFLTSGTGASNFDADMKTLGQTLSGRKVNYKVFTSNVSIKGAKWSIDQSN